MTSLADTSGATSTGFLWNRLAIWDTLGPDAALAADDLSILWSGFTRYGNLQKMKLKLLNQHEMKLLAPPSSRYSAYFACRLASALAVYVVILLAYFTSTLLFFYTRFY